MSESATTTNDGLDRTPTRRWWYDLPFRPQASGQGNHAVLNVSSANS